MQITGKWDNDASRRGLRWALLAALMLLALLRAPYAATHLDFARDMFVAWRFLQGQEVPLAGPVLAATIHLGPAWYWLLAALLGMARSWLGTVLLLGLLSALQYPLAYLAGKAMHSRRAGLLWAVLLGLPAWSAFEAMLPQHYVLTAPLVLAVVLCALRYTQRPRWRYLAGLGLGLVLALHAHPSSAGLVWIVLAAVGAAAWRRQLRLLPLLAAVAVALLPLLPYLLWSWQNDFADLRAGGAYLADAQSTGSLATAPALLYQSVLGGAGYWLDTLLRAPHWLGLAVMSVLALAIAAALGGAVRLWREPATRVRLLQVLAAMAAVTLTTALIRSVSTYYMTTAVRAIALGGVALGLAAAGGVRVAVLGRAALFVLAVAFNLAAALVANRYLASGNWPFNFQALYDVSHPGTEPMRLLLLPAYAMGDSGEFLCSQGAPSVHGAYARHLLYDYAMEMRLACGRSDAQVGGAEPQRQHWLGLAKALAREAGLVAQQRVGPLQLFAVRRVLGGDAFVIPDRPVYPIHLPQDNPLQTRSFTVQLDAGERLAISTMAFFVQPAQVEFGAGKRLQLLGGDAISRVYACTDCAAGETVAVDLRVTTTNFSDTDIVVF